MNVYELTLVENEYSIDFVTTQYVLNGVEQVGPPGPAGSGGSGGGVSDHGALTGLADDDHPQYHNDTRGDVRYYTKAQVDTSLAGKSDTGHTHTEADISDLGDYADATATQTALDAKANDADVVHDTGAETIAGVKTFSSDPIIPDEAYGASWNGSLEPPTKNALYDKIETIGAGGGGGSVDSVVAGTNIDVDSTDPANPVVSVETLSAADVSDFDTEVSNNTDVAANTAARHTHANQATLDATTASFTTADETKLDGVATGATANDTDANLKNRANHTGTQAIATVTGLQTALDAKALAADLDSHTANTSNPHSVTKAQVGLSNVDNTSDASKPISTATQTALDAKEDFANKGVADGYASLDSGGKVPSSQLPSYVDDVLEYANLAVFPATGTTGIIYVAVDTGKTYRWTGTVYAEISPSEVTSVNTRTGAVTGLAEQSSLDAHTARTDNPHSVTKAQVGLSNVDNTSDASKPISTATQTALDTKVDENAAITGATKTKITYDAKGLVTAGADATQDDIGDGTTYKQYSGTEKTKLAGIEAGATANSSDATLLARANHTGTQTAATISDFSTAADARITAATGVSVQAYDAALTTWGTKTAPTGTVVGTTDTQTLTNKRVTERVVALTDGATITVNVDVTDMGKVTLGGNRTIAFSGTPTGGQKLQLRFKQDATGSRTITWPASVRFGTDITATTLTTTASKTDYVGLIYNSDDSKWDCIAFSRGY